MKNPPNDLTRIWARTNGMQLDGSFLFLRVLSPDMPASYLTDDQWFMMCKRIEPGLWRVGIRLDSLEGLTGPHEVAARGILGRLESLDENELLKSDTWTEMDIPGYESLDFSSSPDNDNDKPFGSVGPR